MQPCCIASCALTLPEMACGFADGHATNATVELSTSIGTWMRCPLHSEHIVSVLGHMDPNVQGMLTVLILLDTHLPT